MRQLRNDRGASLVEYALLFALIFVMCIAAIKFSVAQHGDLTGTEEHLNGCVVNYGVDDDPVFLRLEGCDCRGGSIEVASSSTDVRPTVVMEGDEGEITLERDNFPDGTIYHFSVSYVERGGGTTTQPFYAVQDGNGENVQDD